MQHKEVWALALGRAASILALPLPASPGLLGLSSLSVDNLPQSLFQGLNEGCLKALSTTTAQVETAGSCSAQESSFSEAAWLEASLAQPGAGISAACLAHSS